MSLANMSASKTPFRIADRRRFRAPSLGISIRSCGRSWRSGPRLLRVACRRLHRDAPSRQEQDLLRARLDHSLARAHQPDLQSLRCAVLGPRRPAHDLEPGGRAASRARPRRHARLARVRHALERSQPRRSLRRAARHLRWRFGSGMRPAPMTRRLQATSSTGRCT